MKKIAVAAALTALAWPSTGIAEVDFAEIWLACDEAAVEEGFAEAGVPDRSVASESVYMQLGGRWEGQELAVVTAPTSTGQVFCMARTDDLHVVHYKFEGRSIIERD